VGVIQLIGILLRALLANRAALAMENLALRQPLAVLERSVKRPALRQRDRIFWAWLARLWNGWRAALLIVKPETVIKWHRQGCCAFWPSTSSITTTPGRTNHSTATRLCHEPLSRRRTAAWSPRPTSAVCTTATAAPPDEPGRESVVMTTLTVCADRMRNGERPRLEALVTP